jgi:hypothetical protein
MACQMAKKSSNIRDKWQRQILGMPNYAASGVAILFDVAKLRAKWQYRSCFTGWHKYT